MHIANAAMDFLAYTPSNRHFGMNNTTFGTVVIVGVGLVVAWLVKK